MKLTLKPTAEVAEDGGIVYRLEGKTSDYDIEMQKIGKAYGRTTALRSGEIDVYFEPKLLIKALTYEYNKQTYDKKAAENTQDATKSVQTR